MFNKSSKRSSIYPSVFVNIGQSHSPTSTIIKVFNHLHNRRSTNPLSTPSNNQSKTKKCIATKTVGVIVSVGFKGDRNFNRTKCTPCTRVRLETDTRRNQRQYYPLGILLKGTQYFPPATKIASSKTGTSMLAKRTQDTEALAL